MANEGLQEIITRGRFVFLGAAKRLEVFNLVDGKRTSKEIARKARRSQIGVLNDLKKLRDFGLVMEKTDSKGNIVTRERSAIFEKSPLARHVSAKYFSPIADTKPLAKGI